MSDFRLKVFQCVAKHLSFTKAAKELFISQAAVSKNIQELENYYEVKLFERMGGKIELTPAGVEFLELVNEILSKYGNLLFRMHQLSDKSTGILRIGTTITTGQYILPSLLAEFHRRYPHILVALTSTPDSESIENLLIKGQVDIGLIRGYTRERNLKYIPFMKDRIVPFMSTANPLVKEGEGIRLEKIYKMPLALRESVSDTYQIMRDTLLDHEIDMTRLNICAYLDSVEGLKSYLLYSDCVSLLSIYAIRNGNGNLFHLTGFKDIVMERDLCFAMVPQNSQDMLHMFMDHLRMSAGHIYGQKNCLAGDGN